MAPPRLYRGYDGVPDSRRMTPEQKYEFWFDPPTEYLSLRDASIKAAKDFGEAYADKEIMVMYSGGLDSEWVCESFYLAGVPFTPLIVNYDGANEHDLYWARRYLEARKITPLEWKFDLKGWYGSAEQFEIAEASQMAELAYTGQFKAILEHHNSNRVFLNGYDEPVISADDSGADREWLLTYNERHYAIHKLMKHYDIPTQLGGWVDANVFSGYVRSPMWQWLVANLEYRQVWNSEIMKIKIYQRAFPNLELRPKYTGFESMLETVVPATQAWKKSCMERHGTMWLQDWTRPIKDVWKELDVWGRMA